jgi:HK97 family phage prohead protease
MNGEKKEIRSFIGGKCRPMIREVAEGEVQSRTIEGYAIIFDVESRILGDLDGLPYYREIIEPGAITEERLKEMDIKMTMYHNREKILARSRNGEGTLKLSVDEVGVKYSFEAPNTVDGDTALELVKRGDLSGSSFIFWVGMNDLTRERGKDGIYIHRVKNIRRIDDMTIAADPAYEQTSVSAREAYSQFEKKEEKQPISSKWLRDRRCREVELCDC